MRILAWLLLPFCGAIALCCSMKPWWLCWVFVLVSLTACVVVSRKKSVRRKMGALAAVGAMLGFVWFGLYTAVELRPVEGFAGKESAFSAVVAAYPRACAGGLEVPVTIDSGMGKGHRALLYLEEAASELAPGDQIIGEGQYGDARYLGGEQTARNVSRGYFLTIHGRMDSAVHRERLPWWAVAPALGRQLAERIRLLYPEDEGALLTGLITGNKAGLPGWLYTAFRRSGMAHLLAVSGLHVGFLTGVLYILPGGKRRRVVIAIPLLVFFALMTGDQASVWRAVIMAVVLLSAPLFGRENDSITSISVALALLLFRNPYACRGIGLQLSFAAVTGLACFHGKLYHWMAKPLTDEKLIRHPLLHEIWYLAAGAISTALSAEVLTLPLCANYFHSVSLVGPLSNLLSIWCASLAFVLGLLSCLISFVSMPLAGLLVRVVTPLLDWLIGVASWLSRGSFSALALDNPYYTGWFVISVGILVAVILVKGLRHRPVLSVGASATLLLLALTLRMLTLSGSPFTVTALDVGNGSCTVLNSRGNYAAVDCRGQEAGTRLADYLASGGTGRLSLLVLDRLDENSRENVEQLLARVDVDCVALPSWETGSKMELEWSELLQDNGCEVILLNSEIEVSFGEATLSVLPMLGQDGPNALTAPVLCRWEDHQVLICGALSEEQEQALLERWTLPKLDALIVEEGGRKTAAGGELLSRTHPDCAVLSVGGAPFDSPHWEVLERLFSFDTVIYTTDRNGSVTIRY